MILEDLTTKYEILRSAYTNSVIAKMDSADYSEYTEVLFTAHSCAMEKNSFSINDTRELKEKGLSAKIFNHTLLETLEIYNHLNAYAFAMSNLQQSFSENLIKKIHYLLTEDTIYHKTGTQPGQFTETDLAAGKTVFGDHTLNLQQLPELLQETQYFLENKSIHPVSLAAAFHKEFIYLHPFRDGNGRLARLLSNIILAKCGHPQIIIISDKKQSYINALKTSENLKTTVPIEKFFFEVAIERMNNEMQQKDRNQIFAFGQLKIHK